MDPLKLCAVLFMAMTPIALAAIDDYNPKGYFPASNVSQLAWAHKVNTLTELTRVLRDPHIRMIEGDVVMGIIPGYDPTIPEPIMGNPPTRVNSLDLYRFLSEVRGYNRGVTLRERKGIKLDFKEPKAFKEGISWVRYMYNQTVDAYPVWLNGEILVGPNASTEFILNGTEFIEMHQNNFSIATLSLGWKTEFVAGGNYSMDHFNEMADLLKETRPTAHVTFSLRAQLALNSVANIKLLLDQSGLAAYSPSVTLYEEETDPQVGLEELEEFINQIGANRVFVDLPYSFEDGLGQRTTEKDWGNETTEKDLLASSTEGGSGSGARPIINNLVIAGLALLVSVAVFVR